MDLFRKAKILLFPKYFGNQSDSHDFQPSEPEDTTGKNKPIKSENDPKPLIHSHQIVKITTSWANREDLLPAPPIALPDETNAITQFMQIRGNPYSIPDLLSSHIFKTRSVLFYQWQTGWHRGINSRKIFAEISHPETNGKTTQIIQGSYCLLEYPIGYPQCSGQSAKHRSLLNNDWKSFNEEECESSYSQGNPEIQDIEDEMTHLDVEIARNKSIHRLLLLNGPEILFTTPIAVEELNVIYPNKGDFIIELLHNQSVAESIRSIILKRLRERAENLYIKKFEQHAILGRRLETLLPIERSSFQEEIVMDIIRDEIPFLQLKTIVYPIDGVVVLQQYMALISPKEANSIHLRKILTELRVVEHCTLQLPYFHALALYVGALFIKNLLSLNYTDPLSSKSVQTAIEIGFTDCDMHGHARVLKLIAEVFHSKNKVQAIDDAIKTVASLSFSLNYIKACKIVKFGIIFYQVFKDYKHENSNSPRIMEGSIENGTYSVRHNEDPSFSKFDLSQYQVYNPKSYSS